MRGSMRKLLLFIAVFGVLGSSQTLAEPKMNGLIGWYPSHTEWNEYKEYAPYLENAKHPHPNQWEYDDWQVGDWLSQRSSGEAMVRNFYIADIIRDQITDDDVPVVIVGPNFYRLGGYDKRRVIASIDAVYGVTASSQNGAMMVRDWHTHQDIGTFTKYGLTLQ